MDRANGLSHQQTQAGDLPLAWDPVLFHQIARLISSPLTSEAVMQWSRAYTKPGQAKKAEEPGRVVQQESWQQSVVDRNIAIPGLKSQPVVVGIEAKSSNVGPEATGAQVSVGWQKDFKAKTVELALQKWREFTEQEKSAEKAREPLGRVIEHGESNSSQKEAVDRKKIAVSPGLKTQTSFIGTQNFMEANSSTNMTLGEAIRPQISVAQAVESNLQKSREFAKKGKAEKAENLGGWDSRFSGSKY